MCPPPIHQVVAPMAGRVRPPADPETATPSDPTHTRLPPQPPPPLPTPDRTPASDSVLPSSGGADFPELRPRSGSHSRSLPARPGRVQSGTRPKPMPLPPYPRIPGRNICSTKTYKVPSPGRAPLVDPVGGPHGGTRRPRADREVGPTSSRPSQQVLVAARRGLPPAPASRRWSPAGCAGQALQPHRGEIPSPRRASARTSGAPPGSPRSICRDHRVGARTAASHT